jgi:hypothetical protein
MTVVLREQLMAVLPDFGRYLGCDGTDIASHSAGQRARARGRTAGLDADWGHHENARIDARTERIAKGGLRNRDSSDVSCCPGTLARTRSHRRAAQRCWLTAMMPESRCEAQRLLGQTRFSTVTWLLPAAT